MSDNPLEFSTFKDVILRKTYSKLGQISALNGTNVLELFAKHVFKTDDSNTRYLDTESIYYPALLLIVEDNLYDIFDSFNYADLLAEGNFQEDDSKHYTCQVVCRAYTTLSDLFCCDYAYTICYNIINKYIDNERRAK